MRKQFADRLVEAIETKGCRVCVGIDPVIGRLPAGLVRRFTRQYGTTPRAIAKAFTCFTKLIVDAVYDVVPAIKPQMAFFEVLGPHGIEAFVETVEYAHSKGLIVIEDAKRNDIGTTAGAYAVGHLGRVMIGSTSRAIYNVDAITVNPYLGHDGIMPFIEECQAKGKGIFVLVKTSNPSSVEFQDLKVRTRRGEETLSEVVAKHVNKWGKNLIGKHGYSSVGAVVGATFPEQAARLRQIMPKAVFLVPGLGTQGGKPDDVVPCFDERGRGAIINSSRDIIYAWHRGNAFVAHTESEDIHRCIRDATISIRDSVNAALRKAGKVNR